MSLPSSEVLRITEISEVFVVGDHVNWNQGTFKIMSPFLKYFKYREGFFIMDIIILFSRVENSGVEGNWVQFLFYIG